jgi:hypothetical protein
LSGAGESFLPWFRRGFARAGMAFQFLIKLKLLLANRDYYAAHRQIPQKSLPHA